MEKTPEQLTEEHEQVTAFLQTVISELKSEIADLSHRHAVQRAIVAHQEQALKAKDTQLESLEQRLIKGEED